MNYAIKEKGPYGRYYVGYSDRCYRFRGKPGDEILLYNTEPAAKSAAAELTEKLSYGGVVREFETIKYN